MEQARNKDQKCPVVILLDTSGSMSGKPIEELILEGKHYDIPTHIDVLRRIIRVPYDKELIEKGC
jgi:hypothetical protein